MSDFNTQDDYYEEEVPRQTRPRGRRGLPLWPLLVILLLIAVVIIYLWNPFAPSPPPTEEAIPTVTSALPTLPPLPTSTPTPQPTPTPPTEITVGGYVKVVGAEADELSYRSGPGLNYARLSIVKDGTILEVLEGPEEADGYTWWRLEDEDGFIGWAAEDWLEPTLPR
ncbi:MAG: SH3 domain-containing protein [Anaerolineae bacterium]